MYLYIQLTTLPWSKPRMRTFIFSLEILKCIEYDTAGNLNLLLEKCATLFIQIVNYDAFIFRTQKV